MGLIYCMLGIWGDMLVICVYLCKLLYFIVVNYLFPCVYNMYSKSIVICFACANIKECSGSFLVVSLVEHKWDTSAYSSLFLLGLMTLRLHLLIILIWQGLRKILFSYSFLSMYFWMFKTSYIVL